ncbi:hypothetical protein [Paracoccus sp. MKU1]|uniref:hypothetical protein n=1 Tax=Paracoccus sp. MKU1 TaxID=1745182 RepID=UPI0007191820|nr:hypothetical protein [Paracoccus sp. MKU1]
MSFARAVDGLAAAFSQIPIQDDRLSPCPATTPSATVAGLACGPAKIALVRSPGLRSAFWKPGMRIVLLAFPFRILSDPD